MGWKKTMNKKRRQAGKKEECARQSADAFQKEEEKDKLQQYLTELLPEWNLRLLMETELSAETVLWVESVTVTAYHSVPEAEEAKKKSGFWRWLAHLLGRIRKYLIGE